MSLIIPTGTWGAAESLSPFLELLELERLPEDTDAKSVTFQPTPAKPLAQVDDFNGRELVEALFFEDSQPIVVFDAVSPELVATRVLTALWPSMRRQFAISSFALSPRKVGGRDFNLVFAPKDARSKFSDWNGRRIDGRSSQEARHRWTDSVVKHVFDVSHPQLLSSGNDGILSVDGDDGDTAASLRIVLLWDELLAKLDTTPTAALGLLDIANSGKVRGKLALETLAPALVRVVRRVPYALSHEDAWKFIGAVVRKIHGKTVPGGSDAVSAAITELAGAAPEGAMTLLSTPDDQGAVLRLLPAIASGIGSTFTDRAGQALLSAQPGVFGSLVAESSALAEKAASDAALVNRLGDILPQLDAQLVAQVGQQLLPHLVADWQIRAAKPLINTLDSEQLVAEVCHLGVMNDFSAPALTELCLQRVREIGAGRELMTELSVLPSSERRDNILCRILEPSLDDAIWLRRDSRFHDEISDKLFVDLLRRSDDEQLEAIIRDNQVSTDAVKISEQRDHGILKRIIFLDAVPLDSFVSSVKVVFANSSNDEKVQIGKRALHRCLGLHFGGNESTFITTMLDGVGAHLDGAWAARLGLAHGIQASVASRNMLAFHNASKPARLRITSAISAVSQSLRYRGVFDLGEAAAEAFSEILLEADKVAPREALVAANHLVPMLMPQRKKPVSMIIAIAFPLIYHELGRKDTAPSLLKLLPIFDWDRRKVARHDLIAAFMSSSWAPEHLALTACRCSEVSRILRGAAKSLGGEAYINRVYLGLDRLPTGCRKSASKMIDSIRSEWSSRYSWHD